MKVKLIILTIFFSTLLLSQTPSYEFITEPINLITNYYDYMPGSYNSLPVQIEEDGSLYIVFHAKVTADAERRILYTYIDANGVVQNLAPIDNYNIHEGYAGIDIDPVTGDPMVAFHCDFDSTTTDLEVLFSYDMLHLG
ncbi:MAG: hypothetical protein K9N39_01320, partial [Candidatus Cloacimonetes bacterium]|nr:hypothetical protein [Candidatus Cloacimonadota bacterium]